MTLETPLDSLPGIGPARYGRLLEAGLATVEDLLRTVPLRYEDRRRFARVAEIAAGDDPAAVLVEAIESRLIRTRRRGFTITEARFRDDSGEVTAVWYNQPYLARAFPGGRRVVLFGPAVRRPRRREPFVLENPDHERFDEGDGGIHTGRIVPVYRKVAGAGTRFLRRWVYEALARIDETGVAETLPADLIARFGLPSRNEAFRRLHFPEGRVDAEPREAVAARRRFAFEDLYGFQLALAARRAARERAGAERTTDPRAGAELRRIAEELLPFRLTGDQAEVLREIGADLATGRAMARLLQGDVGTGKTALAVVAMVRNAERGRQSALLAPTTVLARQHAERLRALLARSGRAGEVVLLTGAGTARERAERRGRVADGIARFVVGTHALFQESVRFRDLALIVIDEQHRFGVAERAALVGKSRAPDVLVMTATPIPRSLALTLYGDLDVSVLRERPPGRAPVRTLVRSASARRRVHEGVRRQVALGRQAVIVLPRVEDDGDARDTRSVLRYLESLERGSLADVRAAALHGRMSDVEKIETMDAFERGRIDVLVATTVVEVGIDVPNATVLVVEHAERFGLAQLHQLRGRIGRGTEPGHCVLLLGADDPGQAARERLALLERSSDGFEIAEHDLRTRGPGAVFSTRQHGTGDLRFLWVVAGEPEMLLAARDRARALARTPGSLARALQDVPAAWRRRLHLPEAG